MREYDLRGKTVLITGGSRGLGLVLGREFVRQGARVAICARDAEELERASADLVRRGLPVLAVPCDVTDRAAVETMVETVRDHFSQIDVLVNNAGVIEVGPDVLGPRHGVVLVDLVDPGCDPTNSGYKIIDQGTFKDAVPWVVLTVGSEPSE